MNSWLARDQKAKHSTKVNSQKGDDGKLSFSTLLAFALLEFFITFYAFVKYVRWVSVPMLPVRGAWEGYDLGVEDSQVMVQQLVLPFQISFVLASSYYKCKSSFPRWVIKELRHNNPGLLLWMRIEGERSFQAKHNHQRKVLSRSSSGSPPSHPKLSTEPPHVSPTCRGMQAFPGP